MIKSMTGFGRMECVDDSRRICIEMKSVNHRYLDANIRLPKSLCSFEARLRGILKEYAERGKVDIFIIYEELAEKRMRVRYNCGIAEEYMAALSAMKEQFALEDDIRVSVLARFPEVLTMEENPEEEETVWPLLEKTFRSVCAEFTASRITEGEKLKEDLLEKLDSISAWVEEIEKHSPQIIQAYREKLEEKVREMLDNVQIDEARIVSEVTLFADKICVDEEIVRLKSHIQGMQEVLKEGGAVGRKLDFITQEMNREANTILSKAGDLALTNYGIELKTDIEKVREQVQNIE